MFLTNARFRLRQHPAIAPLVHDVIHRQPAVAVIAAGVGELHLGAPGHPPASANRAAPGPSGALDHHAVAPPFFQAITFISTGATSSCAVGANRAACSFPSTSPDGVRWPFMIWERKETSVGVTVVYETADGKEVLSAKATLACTVE